MSTDLRRWWELPPFDNNAHPPSPKNARPHLKDKLYLTDLYSPQHVGLYLDRCLPLPYVHEDGDGHDRAAQKALTDAKAHRFVAYESAIAALRPTHNTPAIQTYRACYERWHKALGEKASGDGVPGQEPPRRAVREIVLETTARALLHPSANQSITDGAVLMHHTYGAPYLPGSGLKGLARAQARRDGHPDKVIRALFGNDREPNPLEDAAENPDQAALVRFLDALWIPEVPEGADDRWSVLQLDVITPHHSDYYTGTEPPGDWQQPVPTQRLTVSPGARFRVILEGCPGPADRIKDWLDLAERLLVEAAVELGFGAYTRAGFGRMTRVVEPKTSAAGAVGGTAAEWEKAQVFLNRGTGALTVMVFARGNKKVGVSDAEGKQLVAALSEDRRSQLRQKGELRLEVRVEPLDATFRVVGLR
jgi:CRISPR type III-B/RAMP module RAMP protein Cmr6